MSDKPPWWSFTIIVTDNDTGQSYDASITVDRTIPPEAMYRDFLNGLMQAVTYFAQSGICPGRERGEP